MGRVSLLGKNVIVFKVFASIRLDLAIPSIRSHADAKVHGGDILHADAMAMALAPTLAVALGWSISRLARKSRDTRDSRESQPQVCARQVARSKRQRFKQNLATREIVARSARKS